MRSAPRSRTSRTPRTQAKAFATLARTGTLDIGSLNFEVYDERLPTTPDQKSVEILNRCFESGDRNQNGELSLAETELLLMRVLRFQKVVKTSLVPSIHRSYRAAKQASGTGSRDWMQKAEFPIFCKFLRFDLQVLMVFQSIDTSDDRRINFEEFKRAMPKFAKRLGLSLSKKLKSEFQKMDSDGGGMVLYDEFADYMLCQLAKSSSEDLLVYRKLARNPRMKLKPSSTVTRTLPARTKKTPKVKAKQSNTVSRVPYNKTGTLSPKALSRTQISRPHVAIPLPTDVNLLAAIPQLSERVKLLSGDYKSKKPCEESQTGYSDEITSLISQLNAHGRALEISRKEIHRELECIHRAIKREENGKCSSATKSALRTEVQHFLGWESALNSQASTLNFLLDKIGNKEKSRLREMENNMNAQEFKRCKERHTLMQPNLKGVLDAAEKLEILMGNFQMNDKTERRRRAIAKCAQDIKEDQGCFGDVWLHSLKQLSATISNANEMLQNDLIPQIQEAQKIAKLVNSGGGLISPSQALRKMKLVYVKKSANAKLEDMNDANEDLQNQLEGARKAEEEQKQALSFSQNRVAELEKLVDSLRQNNSSLQQRLSETLSTSTTLLADNMGLKNKVEGMKEQNTLLQKQFDYTNKGMVAMRQELLDMARCVSQSSHIK